MVSKRLEFAELIQRRRLKSHATNARVKKKRLAISLTIGCDIVNFILYCPKQYG
jgi:hypothetical protein